MAQAGCGLRGERATASAALNGVWIVEGEALLFEAVEPIDGCTIEVQRALLVDHNGNTVMFVLAVGSLVKFVVEAKRVIEAAATAAGDADTKEHAVRKLLFITELLDLGSGAFGENNCHGVCPLETIRIGFCGEPSHVTQKIPGSQCFAKKRCTPIDSEFALSHTPILYAVEGIWKSRIKFLAEFLPRVCFGADMGWVRLLL